MHQPNISKGCHYMKSVFCDMFYLAYYLELIKSKLEESKFKLHKFKKIVKTIPQYIEYNQLHSSSDHRINPHILVQQRTVNR